MKRFAGLIAVAVALVVFGLPSVGSAVSILDVSVDCGAPCFDSTYHLVIDDGGTTDTNYSATLTIDTTNYSGDQDFISGVDFKVASSVTSATLTAAPGTDGNWSTVINAGQVGNNNCSGSGTGFVASCDDPTVAEAPVGGILIWSWNFSTSDTIAFGHIGAKYNVADGSTKGQLVSLGENGTSVPEPGSLVLLGLGLAGFGLLARRLR